LILAVGLAAGALAQGRGFGVLGSPAFLLRRTEVQTDLKLSEDQKKSLMAALEKLAADNQGLRDKLQNASDDERRKLIGDFQAAQTKAINAVLNADQQKRLRQVSLQQAGAAALADDPKVAEELKLTDEQKAKVRDLLMQQFDAVRQAFQGGAGAAAFDKADALRKETNEKAVALLTDEQKTRWKNLVGAELKLQPFRPAMN